MLCIAAVAQLGGRHGSDRQIQAARNTHRIVDHALGSAGKAQRAVALIHVHGGRRDVADDGRLGIATQGGLQDASQLAVAVGDVATCSPEQWETPLRRRLPGS